MNAVEIEEAISTLCEAPFDPASFPYAFLQAFGLNDTAVRKLKTGDANKSDCGGVLQRTRNNIHIKTCAAGQVAATLTELRSSPATTKLKARFILATDGQSIQAERFEDGDVLACDFKDLPNRFAYFLSLAGISTVKRIDENAFDIRATGRLNKLYVELLRMNPDWDTDARRQDLNHFFARLIFCFFAEDTGIFLTSRLFTDTLEQMTARDGSNVHDVLSEIFRAMDIRPKDRDAAKTRPYADSFPYVNGNLFGGGTDTPRFNQSARNYLLFVGNLDWKLINPDIFGSMIQAVADDEERGALGMHYTSVPNILKVLNPLFLDELRAKLEEAGDGKTPGSLRKLLNLRNRIARIRVLDPACGSGNFLVIAYKELRQIEAEINRRRGEEGRRSELPISNFRGIELRHFPAEIARLALIIAEFQCNVLFSGELFARQEFLPLDAENWITCGNALRLDWLSVCPPTGTGVKLTSNDLFNTPKDQAEIDFEHASGETYICGNPPYVGRKYQTAEQKNELKAAFADRCNDTLSLDYVTGWFVKAHDYMTATKADSAFVATCSICQGVQVASLWPILLSHGVEISFAHAPFKWSNLASNNAGVAVSIIGMAQHAKPNRRLFDCDSSGTVSERSVRNINGYLVPAPNVFVLGQSVVPDDRALMQFGNHPYYANALMLRRAERDTLAHVARESLQFLRPLYGSNETISGAPRFCIWIEEDLLQRARSVPEIDRRLELVRAARLKKAADKQSLKLSSTPHRFRDQHAAESHVVIVPIVSSENRDYLPIELKDATAVVHNKAFALYDAALWNLALVASRLHLVWIGTVCGRLEMRFSYSNTLGWNTFPVPKLTDENKAALTRCAEDILLAREAHFPATIADMYDPEAMDTKYPDLRAAHDRNDETLERIYIGRRFRNDTERLEKLFEIYTQMIASSDKPTKVGRTKSKGT